MLKEFVESISALTTKGSGFDVLDLPGGKERLIRHPSGAVSTVVVPPANVRFEAQDLQSFADIIEEFGTLPVVFIDWCNPHVVVTALLDQADRRDRVFMQIDRSGPLTALTALAQWTKQKEVCAAIRDQLFEGVEPDLLTKMRSLDFKRRNDGSRTIEHGSESLGRSVEVTVQSSRGELPEFTSVRVPWFANDDFASIEHVLPITVDLDATNENIRFVVRGDAWKHANDAALRAVQKRISDVSPEVTVVIGRPNVAVDGKTY